MTATEARASIGGQALDPNAPLLDVEDLHVQFRIDDGVVKAVNGLTYSLDAGESLAILGESGSGKSVSAQAVMGILDMPPGEIPKGSVRFRGVELLGLSDNTMAQDVRANRIAMVFQDALTALNPVFSVGWQIGEVYRKHRGMSRKDAKKFTLIKDMHLCLITLVTDMYL